MLKRVDVATYDFFKDAKNGTWKAGVQTFGSKNDGVGYAVDDSNKAILSAAAKAKGGRRGKADIISGKITVHDYMCDNKCPV